ncbi:MAG: dockerin type I domain-containing protein, partial [Tepidisphaeraceae bacterium]
NLYDNVTFNDANNGNYNVTLNTLIAATSVTFANNAGNYTLSGSGGIGGAATLNITGSAMVTISTSNSYTGPTTVTGGKLIIAAADALPAGNAVTIGNGTSPATMQLADGIGQASLSSLTINPGAVLDIANNAIAINYTPGNSPAATIRQLIATGYANDTWTGPGIDSSAAALNPGRFAVGYADGNVDQGTAAATNQVVVEYTLAGDANLDGTVNFADLLVVAQNFNHTADTHGNPIDWADGDFDYDGVVNFADLLLVAQNFNQSLSAGQLDQLPGSFAAAWNLALADVRASDSNNVPEPATLSFLALGAAGMLARRRRK